MQRSQRFCDLVKGRLISVSYIYIYIYICQEEARWYQQKLGSLKKYEFKLDVCDCRNESDGKMTEMVKLYGEWLFAAGRVIER